MILTVVHSVVLVAVVLKVISNLALPYRVLRLHEGESISLGFPLLSDALLFTFAVGIAWAADRPVPLFATGKVAAAAGGAIIGSYVHYFAVLMVNDWLQRRRGRGSRAGTPGVRAP